MTAIYYQNILLKGTELSQPYRHLNDKGVLQKSGEGTVRTGEIGTSGDVCRTWKYQVQTRTLPGEEEEVLL